MSVAEQPDLTPRLCLDVGPPQFGSPQGPLPGVGSRIGDRTDPEYELAVARASRWPPGVRLRLAFLDGDPRLHEAVMAVARRWSGVAAVSFDVGEPDRAHLRISFRHVGAWSAIGTDARLFSPGVPTMNLGWLRADTPESEIRRVVLHEFGHALGFVHEHQSPAANVPWDVARVRAFFKRTQRWSEADVERNLFARYARTSTNSSTFDPQSIMLYPIPAELTEGGFSVGWNNELSAVDQAIAALHYPRDVHDAGSLGPGETSRDLPVPSVGTIHTFTVDVQRAGTYVFATSGAADLAMLLRGPLHQAHPRVEAFDDDSGRGPNARLVRKLGPGTYRVLVAAATTAAPSLGPAWASSVAGEDRRPRFALRVAPSRPRSSGARAATPPHSLGQPPSPARETAP